MTKLTPLKSTSKNQNQARFWDSQSSFSGSSCLLVKIISGDVAGWGEAENFDPTKPIVATIEHVLARRIISKSVQPTVLSEEL